MQCACCPAVSIWLALVGCLLLLVVLELRSIVRLYLTIVFVYQKGRPGAMVRAVSPSHQVVGSKQPLRRFAGGRLASFPFPRPHSCGSLWHWVCPFFFNARLSYCCSQNTTMVDQKGKKSSVLQPSFDEQLMHTQYVMTHELSYLLIT